MADESVFIYLATYETEAEAKLDYDAVKDLHSTGIVGTYDAAIITKDADGKVKVHKHEKPTQHGAWTGAAVGAVVGILFPPALLLDIAVGGLAGGAIGHFWNGMSRKDVMELGELMDDSSAALLVVGRSKLDKALEKAVTRANKVVEKEIKADVKELDKELKKAEKEAEKDDK
ncbi:MAG: DUF1269 domain-containing protein [Actinobacteria bacterium]|nr:DUF1269 domain-containing protein [Actinomycetota bacterium]